MNEYTKKLKHITRKAQLVLREDPRRFISRGIKYTYYHTFPNQKPKNIKYKDILFIDGTNVDFLLRYRVEHLIEQLMANGLTADSIYAGNLSLDLVKRYSGFVFYRNVPNDKIRKFIELAKYYNKACFFSIDDLVIDTEYTDSIQAVQELPKEQREEYDSGVRGYGDMMRLCNYAITTTEPLAVEMKKHGAGEVHINRNVMSQGMVGISDEAIKTIKRDPHKVILGYFSGSSTHNIDFEMLIPAIKKIMEKYDNVYLKLVGRLTAPEGLKEFEDRLIFIPFVEWTILPSEIRECDINLSPLAEDSVFNRAKSENKWSEAALVQTVTLASNIGAFKSEIIDGLTGVLANNNEWFEKLELLITNKQLRKKIALAAYEEVRAHRTTLGENGRLLTAFLRKKMAQNIKFIIPSIDISGGINVIFKHADILRIHGYDVTLVSLDKPQNYERFKLLNHSYNVVIEKDTELNQIIDKIVATHWLTFRYMKKYPNAIKEYYLVQGYESYIYPPGRFDRIQANATYADKTGVQYITISPWCVKWLKENFDHIARYAPNGLDLTLFPETKRVSTEKTKILIEGNYKDPLKNIDEAFDIISHLDREKFNISYLSYHSLPKEDYKVDEIYTKISPDEVGHIYGKNDILLKTSLLESFSYPPLEMMATGGIVVAIKNEGNAEYISEENALLIKSGDPVKAAKAIENMVANKELQKELRLKGLETVKKYEWKKITKQIISLYN